jgi:hypothetical protein
MNEQLNILIKNYIYETLSTISDTKTIRGKDRQKKLNLLAVEVVKHKLNLDINNIEFEYRIEKDGWGRSFTVDALIEDKQDKYYIVLAKSVQSDYNSNANNYMCNTCGEITRTLGNNCDIKTDKVIFVNFIPLICPVYKNKKFTWQKIKHKNNSDTIKELIEKYDNKVDIINIYYNLKGYELIKDKQQFSSISLDDIIIHTY